nr:hypothetical protein [uncultured Desulfobacter sp.]
MPTIVWDVEGRRVASEAKTQEKVAQDKAFVKDKLIPLLQTDLDEFFDFVLADNSFHKNEKNLNWKETRDFDNIPPSLLRAMIENYEKYLAAKKAELQEIVINGERLSPEEAIKR